MNETLQAFLANGAVVLGYVAIVLLCLGGLVLCCLTISGNWLVLLASVIAVFLTRGAFPSWWAIAILAVISVGVEVVEAVAGYLGVVKRGGSRWGGIAALVGGLVGLILGSMLLPVIGSLLGMLAGSFLLAFWVEKVRLQKADQAAGIALAGVLARVMVLLMKIVVTLGMCGYLGFGLVMQKG